MTGTGAQGFDGIRRISMCIGISIAITMRRKTVRRLVDGTGKASFYKEPAAKSSLAGMVGDANKCLRERDGVDVYMSEKAGELRGGVIGHS